MIRKFKSWIQYYFGFTRSETNGTIVLLLITFLIILVPFLLRIFISNSHHGEVDRLILDSLVAAIENNKPPLDQKPDLFPFNPNTAAEKELLALGIDEKAAKHIVNYRKAGGIFNTKKDLLKIYGLTEVEYTRIYAFIDLPENSPSPSAGAPQPKPGFILQPEYKPHPLTDYIDINLADSTALMSIRGIGPVFSNRIIRFRNALGGFASEEQFSEVYKLNEEALKNLKDAAYIDTIFTPQKLNLNFANARELSKHPYISGELARNIVAFRSANGPYKDAEDPSLQKIIPDSLLIKLKPYILF